MSKPGSQWVHHTTCCQPISSVVLQVVDQTSQTLIRHDDHQLSADTSRNPIFTTTNELHYARVSHCGKCQHVSLVGIATTLCHCQYLTHHTDDTESRHSLNDTVPLSVSDTPHRRHGVTTQSQRHCAAVSIWHTTQMTRSHDTVSMPQSTQLIQTSNLD